MEKLHLLDVLDTVHIEPWGTTAILCSDRKVYIRCFNNSYINKSHLFTLNYFKNLEHVYVMEQYDLFLEIEKYFSDKHNIKINKDE